MNDAYIHLAINHFPIILPIIGLLLMLAGLMIRSQVVTRSAYAVFILGAILTFPVSSSGEKAEHIVEELPGVEERFIEEHEEAAETFAILSYCLGGISLAGLWASLKQKSFSKIIVVITLIFAGVVLYFAMKTGNTGGEIRHQEIRKDFAEQAG
jgi:hypothetical protein